MARFKHKIKQNSPVASVGATNPVDNGASPSLKKDHIKMPHQSDVSDLALNRDPMAKLLSVISVVLFMAGILFVVFSNVIVGSILIAMSAITATGFVVSSTE